MPPALDQVVVRCPARRSRRRRPPRRGRPARRSTGGGRCSRRCGPRDTRSSASVSACSVSGSTDEVASSRISSPGSPSWARASATSWRSPTERFVPRSPTGASRPPGRSSSHPPRPERREGGPHLVVGGVGPPDAHVLAERSCRTGSRPAAPCGSPRGATPGRPSRRSTPPTRTAPRGRVGEAAQQLGDRGLAGARLADHRDRGAGREVQVDAAQHLDRRSGRRTTRRRGRRGARPCGRTAPPIRLDDVDRAWPGRRGSCASRRWRSGSGRGSRSARRSGAAAG